VSVLFQSSADVGQSLALRSISQESANLLSSADVLDLKSWGKGELEFVSLLLVVNDKSVQISRASDLELGVVDVSLNLDSGGVLSSSSVKELLDLFDLLRHDS